MIDIKKLRELIKLMVGNDLTELNIESEGERVSLKRHGEEVPVPVVTTVQAAPAPQSGADVGQHPAAGESPAPAAPKPDGLHVIKSPMVGTYYSAASPDSPPFIQTGDRINAESVVCIIEAMKVFNEIKAECDGEIAEILVQSGQAIEFDQPLFKVRPG